jgi:hypothetical protein
MKKLQTLGKTLSRDEQKRILGGEDTGDNEGLIDPCLLGGGTCSSSNAGTCCPGYMCCHYLSSFACVTTRPMC